MSSIITLYVILQKLDINLIMTDYCMPEMTGYDLLKRVKVPFLPLVIYLSYVLDLNN